MWLADSSTPSHVRSPPHGHPHPAREEEPKSHSRLPRAGISRPRPRTTGRWPPVPPPPLRGFEWPASSGGGRLLPIPLLRLLHVSDRTVADLAWTITYLASAKLKESMSALLYTTAFPFALVISLDLASNALRASSPTLVTTSVPHIALLSILSTTCIWWALDRPGLAQKVVLLAMPRRSTRHKGH